jgi:DNA invertase Pin-like site-specific DNA recombinase
MKSGGKVAAIAYLRTSSAANVGQDKDSERRQRAAITGFAQAHGYVVEAEFYDAAVSGADPVVERPGFLAMLQRIAGMALRRSLSRALIVLPATWPSSSPAMTC